MNFAATRSGIVGLGLALSAPASAAAQSVGGEMGPLSRASIRISVSVSPRFQVQPALADAKSFVDGDGRAAPGLAVASNGAPSLRYSVLAPSMTSASCLAGIPPKSVAHDASERCPSVGQTGQGGRAAPLVLIVIPD
jgi:hypothetical protein